MAGRLGKLRPLWNWSNLEAILLEKDDKERSTYGFSEREMDKIIRQIVDRVRVNYFQNGEGRGIPAEIKRIIEASVDRV